MQVFIHFASLEYLSCLRSICSSILYIFPAFTLISRLARLFQLVNFTTPRQSLTIFICLIHVNIASSSLQFYKNLPSRSHSCDSEKLLTLSPAFPPLHTVRASFPAYGAPTNPIHSVFLCICKMKCRIRLLRSDIAHAIH